MEVADRDRVCVAQRPRRDLGDRPRADAAHRQQPPVGLGHRQVDRLLQPVRDGRRALDRAGALLVDARASPVPDGDGRQPGVGRHPKGADRGRAPAPVLPDEGPVRGLGVQADHLLLEDRGDERLEHVGRPRDAQARQAAVRVVDHAVQARVEAVRGVAAPSRSGVCASARSARAPRGDVDAVGALAQVPGGRTVGRAVACQMLPSAANDQAGSPPPRRRRPSVRRRSTGAAGR